MLVGLAGLLSGYNGNFEFKSGTTYPDDLHYTPWRVMMATYGVLMVPIAWYTAHGLGWRKWSIHLVTLMVLLGESPCEDARWGDGDADDDAWNRADVAWLTISRFILLDSMLLFFTFTTVLGLVNFHNQQLE